MKVAVIPARGGSKRIPRKNIKEFCGKPMIAWAIEAAKNSGCFDHIIVSTDDSEIAEVAKDCGADVPFIRPKELSDDHTATRPVINHAIKECEKLYGPIDYVCCIYATSPLLDEKYIREAYSELINSNKNFVFSAGEFSYPIQRAFRFLENGGLERTNPEHRNTRSQDLERTFHDAGQFYWGKTQAFLDNLDSVSENSTAYVLPSFAVQDIDTEQDWIRAELMRKSLDYKASR